MPYTGNPATNAVDRIRLTVGDTFDDMELLSDADYEYFIAAAGSERRAVLDAARAILFKLARFVRERTGDIEVYGGDWWTHYRTALQDVIKNPDLAFSIAIPYAGGISRSDMIANDLDPDTVSREIGVGYNANRKVYDYTYQRDARRYHNGHDHGYGIYPTSR